jgi:hypothetical protein
MLENDSGSLRTGAPINLEGRRPNAKKITPAVKL